MILQDRLIIVNGSKFWPALLLPRIICAWVIHIVCCSRKRNDKNLCVGHVTSFFYFLHLDHLHDILKDVSSVHLRVIWVISIGVLKTEAEVHEFILIEIGNFIFPV